MHNNNQYNPPHLRRLSEALEYKDLDGMMKPRVHIDEFASKMGDDADIIVISFFVRDQQASKDLMNWFEKGYDFVLDADKSPGEIKANRYLVYVELRRRSNVGEHVQSLLEDLSTLTEYTADDWTMHYKNKDYPWSVDTFNSMVPLSPRQYREEGEEELNEMRVAAGIAPVSLYEKDPAIAALQHAAGI